MNFAPPRCSFAAIPAYDRFRLETYRQRGVNRDAIAILDGDGWTAFRFDRVGYFNYIEGLSPADVRALLPELRAFYRNCPFRFRFHFQTDAVTADVEGFLRRSGFKPESRHTRLRHPPTRARSVPVVPAERIERVVPAQADALFRLYLQEFGAPRENWAEALANMRLLLADTRLRAWWVRQGAEPVAFGMLFSSVYGPLLCGGATRADRRNRGHQRSLIRQRLTHAAGLDAEPCLSWASSGSVSASNLMREGFEAEDEIWEWNSPPPSAWPRSM